MEDKISAVLEAAGFVKSVFTPDPALTGWGSWSTGFNVGRDFDGLYVAYADQYADWFKRRGALDQYIAALAGAGFTAKIASDGGLSQWVAVEEVVNG